MVYTATITETVRFYSHVDALCTENNNPRERNVVCGSGGAPCFNASQGQYPSLNFDLPSCDGSVVHTIASDAYAVDYSAVNVVAGNTYTFSSSIPTDWITISDFAGTIAYGFGLASVTYTATATETVRFYSHVDAGCTEDTNPRERNVICSGGASVAGPCLNAPGGMYPTDDFVVPNCDGTPNIIATDCYAGDYSKVVLNGGNTYGFESSVATDWITLTDSSGSTVLAYGQSPINNAAVTGIPELVIRFYTHTDSLCGEATVDRSRIVTCIGSVGLTEILESDISLFPNPAHDKISISGAMTYDEIELVSVEGRVLQIVHPTSTTTEIDVNTLDRGTYFVRIKSNGVAVTKEFVKN